MSGLNFDRYQELAARTSNPGLEMLLRRAVAGLGVAAEGGEVADIIKKEVGHGHPEDVEKIGKELGDVLWYVAEIATLYGLSMEQIAYENIRKLKARYPEGFSEERSINRVD